MRVRLPQVVLVGRINAGKSTVFNRLSETTKAFISPIPGTTRDLNYAEVSWQGKTFELVDTGGLDAGQLGAIEQFVQKKAYRAITKADCIVMVIDGIHEPTPTDRTIALQLKKSHKHIILAVNKIDNARLRRQVSPDFTKLGIGHPHIISAINGIGTGDLLDAITEQLPTRSMALPSPDVRISIIGKTNVGKSSLLNSIVGEERVIVTPIPHTTREPQDTRITYRGKHLLLVDTAGLRKKRSRADTLEKMSAQRTRQAIGQSDVCLLITDASQPLSSQDQAIADLAREHQNGILLVVNKWDLIPDKGPQTFTKFIEYYQHFFPGLYWAPIIFISAQEKQRISKLLDLALAVRETRQSWLPADGLHALIQKMRQEKNVSRIERHKKKSSYLLKQIAVDPPRFDLIVGRREDVHPSFINLIEKNMRQQFDLAGTPISITLQRSR